MTTLEEVSNRLSKLEGAYEHLATKADMNQLKADMKHLATKADLNQHKADVEKAINNQTRWMIATFIATASLVVLITRLLG